MAWPGNPAAGWANPQPYAGVDPRHVFVPPQYTQPPPAWWGVSSPPATQVRSSKYPTLNPVLAEDTSLLRFDIKRKPSNAILASTYFSTRQQLALASPTHHIRLISKIFPWQIDIMSRANITCDDVWDSLHRALQEPIADSEWGFIVQDKKLKENIEKTAEKRMEADALSSKQALRIDYLGETTLFRGLEKDDSFAKFRLMPSIQPCSETWMVKLVS